MQKLTSLIYKKKFEILIPQINAVAPVTNDSNGIHPGQIHGILDSKKSTNEESGSTAAHSMNGEVLIKPSGLSTLKPKAAP